MLIVTKRRYKRQHVIGGSGLFDSVVNFVKRLASSNAAKAAVSTLASAAQTEVGKKAIEAGKTVAKEIGSHAIDIGKDLAIAKAKKILNTALSDKSKATLEGLVSMGAAEARMAGSGIGRKKKADARAKRNEIHPTGHPAISIQDLVKSVNMGSGLRLA